MESMTSNTCLNMDEVGERDVGEVVVLVHRMVRTKEDILRRRIRDHPLRTPGIRLGGRVKVDGGVGEVGSILSHQSTLSGSVNENGGRSG